MMHPNHKVKNTRLKLIKILTTNPNCETILKCALSLPDSQPSAISSNSKLSFYFNSLFDLATAAGSKKAPHTTMSSSLIGPSGNGASSTSASPISGSLQQQHHHHQHITNNDKEVLHEFNQILTHAGLNYKTEYYAVINAYTRNSAQITGFESSNSPDLASFAAESTYLIVNTDSNWLRASVDLTTQFDKELDDEILKIFRRATNIFNLFLETYERLVAELSHFSYNLTNKVVLMQSSVRKQLFQRLKNKLIRQHDVRQSWMGLIESVTHERCMWFDEASTTSFYILDQTESPSRERRRLKKSHLYIPERFFKPEVRWKLAREKNLHPLKYLLNSYEDYLNGGVGGTAATAANGSGGANKGEDEGFTSTTFAANSYMLNQWKYSENIL
jgi:hypothetical protein